MDFPTERFQLLMNGVDKTLFRGSRPRADVDVVDPLDDGLDRFYSGFKLQLWLGVVVPAAGVQHSRRYGLIKSLGSA